MNRTHKIVYWVSTLWLSLGMVSTGLVQLMHSDAEVERITRLGYPVYFLSIIGVWKLLGVSGILVPRFPVIKEWAYAGFFFTMSGAIISHLVVNDPATELFGPTLLIVLTCVSWYFRPESRRIVSVSQ